MNDSPTNTAREFQVGQRDLTMFRVVEHDSRAIAEGEIRLSVESFAFTANNITYGAAGDFLGYWQFFPASDNADGAWGILPVWGFADVVESTIDSVPVGDRLYGYFPPATEVIMAPTNVSGSKLLDGSAHRQSLPPLYNRYQRVLNQADYDRARDDVTSLLSPLHLTSFCLVDQLKQQHFYGAKQVVITSASSKTSLGTAFGLGEIADAPRIVGLTSQRNREFVEGTGLYDQVVTYGSIADALDIELATVIDMAGNPEVTVALDGTLGSSLAHYIAVGITHWEELGWKGERPAIPIEQFFAPTYILERVKSMPMDSFDHESRAFVARAAEATSSWMDIERRSGIEQLAEVYSDIVSGIYPPGVGLIVVA